MSLTTRNIESVSVNSCHGSDESTWTITTSETQPLLADTEGQAHVRKRTPLPVQGLAALCAVRLVDPIVFTQIFPYVNEMIDNLHLTDDPSQLGFYSGLVESTFAISQLFSIYSWARLSDKIGRRPVIIMGILGVAVTTLFLGLSRSLQGILIARFLAGLAAGNVAVIHSVLGELTDSTNQDIAFPIYGLTWPVGTIIGPLIGGTFSRPAEKYSWLDCALFRTYPYLLPGIIAAGVATLGAVAGMIFLDETLPSKRRKYSNDKSQPNNSGDDLQKMIQPAEPPSMRELLALPVIRSLTLSGSALAFVQTSYDVVFVLFAYTPIQIGGLAFTSREIGYLLSMQGVLAIGIQIIILPSLLRRVRSETIYSVCMSMWPLAFIIVPFLNVVARAGLNADNGRVEGSWAAVLWACLAFQTLLTRIACIAYSVNMILLRDHAPSASALGTTNGLAQLFMSLARAFAPAAASSAFALSIDNSLLGGHMWVGAMVGVSVLGIFATCRIAGSVTEKGKDGTGGGKLDRLQD